MKVKLYIPLLLIACLFFTACKKKKNAESDAPESLPSVSTSPVTGIYENSAIAGGAIISEGETSVTETGICFDTVPAPDLNKGSKVKATSSGNYTCAISGMKSYTKYFVRAYAINSNGTAYGNEISFTSSDIWRLQSVNSSTAVSVTCIKSSGNELYIGTASGVFYSPDAGDSWQTAGLAGSQISALAINNNLIFAATTTNAIYRSSDKGQTWTNIRPAVAAPYTMDILSIGQKVYRTEYNAVYLSSDAGDNWVNATPTPTYPMQFGRLMHCSDKIYTPSVTYTSLYKTGTGAVNWQFTTDLNMGVSPQFAPDVDCSGNTIFFGTEKGLYLSENEGQLWKKVTQVASTAILISASGTSVFAATANGAELSFSEDSGTSWKIFSKNGLLINGNALYVNDVQLCGKSIFLYSTLYKRFYRYRR